MQRKLELQVEPQPDDATCGATCLHAVYRFFGDDLPLRQLISEIPHLETGGTLAVWLGCHALRRGYRARIYTYNLDMFDPTWFADRMDLRARLIAQAEVKPDPKLRVATGAYLEFLSLGGEILFRQLNPVLLRRHLKREQPVLCGLSATYLYGCARESGQAELEYDDVAGVPVGHFVVLYGYESKWRTVRVADPLQDNPRFGSHYYSVGIDRVLGAILLGVLTYDANLLVLEPRRAHRESS